MRPDATMAVRLPMHSFRPSRAAAAFAIVIAILAVYYWRFTHISLSTGFGQDDLMNLYFAWREPFENVLKANLFFRTPVVRPFGALLYVTSFQLWGYDGFPLRVICYAVLWLNVPVAYLFVRRLTGSREIAVIAVLLHCVHSCYFPMYYGSGSVYDVFSFFLLLFSVRFESARARSGPDPQRDGMLRIGRVVCLRSEFKGGSRFPSRHAAGLRVTASGTAAFDLVDLEGGAGRVGHGRYCAGVPTGAIHRPE